jgi:uncharacterized protein
MNRILPRAVAVAAIAAVAVLAACGSAPQIHYHTLLAPASASAAPPPAVPLVLELLPITMPAQAELQQIIVRQGDEALLVLDDERWIAPLADEFRSALSAELTRRLGATEVTGLARPAGVPLLRIKVDVRRFESEPGRQALIEAVWSVRSTAAGDERVALCTSLVREAVGADVASLVQGLQRATAALGRQIAAGTASRAQGASPACPAPER